MASQHYLRMRQDPDPTGTLLPLTDTHYLRVPCADSLLTGHVAATVWDSGAVKEVITAEQFDACYEAVDMATDPDQQNLPTAPIVTSQNGTQYVITVDNEGNVVATPITAAP